MIRAIILAAGTGSRMQNATPKQFIKVNDKELMIYSLETFASVSEIDEIIVVTSKEYIFNVKSLIAFYKINKVRDVIVGGSSRQESVFNALKYLRENGANNDDFILIHDSARALVSKEIILNNILALNEYDGVNTVIPATDSIITSKDGKFISSLCKRSELYLSQTPQSFKFSVIYKAHENIKNLKDFEITDDCSLVLKLGKEVYLVPGEKLNFKVTTKEDLLFLKTILDNK